MMTKGMYSSATDLWSTPQDFYDKLNEEFKFTLDPCATKDNAKCVKFYTAEDDGLSKDWARERVFCNPPYGTVISKWVEKLATGGGRYSGRTIASTDRYQIFPPVHIGEMRDPFPKRKVEVRGI